MESIRLEIITTQISTRAASRPLKYWTDLLFGLVLEARCYHRQNSNSMHVLRCRVVLRLERNVRCGYDQRGKQFSSLVEAVLAVMDRVYKKDQRPARSSGCPFSWYGMRKRVFRSLAWNEPLSRVGQKGQERTRRFNVWTTAALRIDDQISCRAASNAHGLETWLEEKAEFPVCPGCNCCTSSSDF
ncbi:uncharacterized protein MYCFIDRAFT_172458 [Pseudocercospora fijiensis CIRAD86]|uniref:Uncharacterized protein n=1 Tax=Pseudocercospora fijiensis (strain CIRAD86) TaxID=383855 RepID=M3A6Q7_PSEFD|nr:uncharacterized protein MYCFIDRAFT_172458 [Pseudocercospora fijiensis CIRAD86]EME86764.1 hypothetical protein MYCFIDRAFT_172458 [Pseudocercospora fijiensis CIRAD86]